MKFITVSGPPSSGKTSVLANSIKSLLADGEKVGIVKFDCLSTTDDAVYNALGVTVRTGLSGNLCPDHYFVSNINECLEWGYNCGFDILISESAGLCNRCSPHIKDVLAVCVIDNLMGINTPKKIGPMLRYADVIVITKGDIVSQAEREVFAYRVRQSNIKAKIIHVNGITGQGAHELAMLFCNSADIKTLNGNKLRFSMPVALCSYCLGETQIGNDFQVGMIKKLNL
jgi:Ni2+-binding GTPase involved in maturation of urease and hydrogenase